MGKTLVHAVDYREKPEAYSLIMSKYDEGSGQWQYKGIVVEPEKLKAAINAGKIKVDNIEVSKGELVGTTGSLNRFKANHRNGIPNIVILSEIRLNNPEKRLVGYRVARGGKVSAVKIADLLDYCDKFRDKFKNILSKLEVFPIQNAMYVPATEGKAACIRAYNEGQFFVEYYTYHKPENAKPAEPKKNAVETKKLSDYFTEAQIKELHLGKTHGVNFKLYANPKLSAEQMAEVRKALEDGVDPSSYTDPSFDVKSMKAYRIQQKYGVDINEFVNPEYNHLQIIELSTAYISGVDVRKLADPKKTADDMAKERVELESKLWNECPVSIIDQIDALVWED